MAFWTREAFLEFASQNLLRPATRAGQRATMRMVDGGLPYAEILGLGRNANYCFATGLTRDLRLPLRCAPRGLEVDVDEDFVVVEEDPESDGAAAAAPDAGELRKARQEKAAQQRARSATKKERGALCTAARKALHLLERAGGAVAGDEAVLAVLEALGMVQAVVEEASEALRAFVESDMQLEFWSWEDGSFAGAMERCAEYVPVLTRALQAWIDALGEDESDGTFAVFPAVNPRTHESVAPLVARLSAERHEAMFRSCPRITALPYLVSAEALRMSLEGEPALDLPPLAERGLGELATRDFIDDWRLVQLRDERGLSMVTNAIPLIGLYTDRDVCLAELRRELSRIMFTRDDLFKPELVQHILPSVQVSLLASLMRGPSDMDWPRLGLYPMLYYTCLEVVHECDAESDGAVFTAMYNRVMRFSISRAREGRRIRSLPALVCEASLAGIPWERYRDSFVREFLVRAVRRHGMRESATEHDYLRHLNNSLRFSMQIILCLLAFEQQTGGGGRMLTLRQRLEIFRRNRGVLPAAQLREVRTAVETIMELQSLDEFFLLTGVVPIDAQDHEVRKTVLRHVRWAMAQAHKPLPDARGSEEERGALMNARLAALGDNKLQDLLDAPITRRPIAEFNMLRHGMLSRKTARIAKDHEQDVPVSRFQNRRLPESTCAHCGAEFSSRSALFRQHLDHIFGRLDDPSNPRWNRYAGHAKLDESACFHDKGGTFACAADGCRFSSTSKNELYEHLSFYGAPGDWTVVAEDDGADDESAAAAATAPVPAAVEEDFDLEECVVCFADTIGTMLLPCGHQVMCATCADSIAERHGTCPICRTDITTVVVIAVDL